MDFKIWDTNINSLLNPTLHALFEVSSYRVEISIVWFGVGALSLSPGVNVGKSFHSADLVA